MSVSAMNVAEHLEQNVLKLYFVMLLWLTSTLFTVVFHIVTSDKSEDFKYCRDTYHKYTFCHMFINPVNYIQDYLSC